VLNYLSLAHNLNIWGFEAISIKNLVLETTTQCQSSHILAQKPRQSA
jgi:hypothetical protein